MKITSSTVVLSLLLACPIAGLAAEKADGKAQEAKQTKIVKTKKSAAKSQKTENVALTGSYIKKDIHRNGIVTDGVAPVAVLDEEMIRNSGAADLREVLVRRGLNR